MGKLCDSCSELIKNNSKESIPHSSLTIDGSSQIKNVGQPKYSSIIYSCKVCGAKIEYNDDRNDSVNWHLV